MSPEKRTLVAVQCGAGLASSLHSQDSGLCRLLCARFTTMHHTEVSCFVFAFVYS